MIKAAILFNLFWCLVFILLGLIVIKHVESVESVESVILTTGMGVSVEVVSVGGCDFVVFGTAGGKLAAVASPKQPETCK